MNPTDYPNKKAAVVTGGEGRTFEGAFYHRDTNWQRTNIRRPCPICGRTDWCSVSEDGAVAVCMRMADGAIQRTRNGGYLHRLGERRRVEHVRVLAAVKAPSRHDLPVLAERYRTAVNPARLNRHADALGVTVESLNRLRVGWAYDAGAWSFPMTDADGVVRGMRFRNESGRKWSLTGGREGLFIPADLPDGGPLLMVEGPTDTAALLDLGLGAVGRPCCTGGVKLLVELVTCRRVKDVVVVADNDPAGERGAAALASTLAVYASSVRIIRPPDGVKDSRAWKLAGARAEDVADAVAHAPAMKLVVKGVRP